MIARKLSTEIENLLEIFPAVVIVGPRQCGKTTLAKEIAKQINKQSVYLDLESPSDRNKLHEPELFFDDNQDKCVILDEIQRMPELFPILRSAIDKNRVAGRFIILGSASPKIMKDSSESLAGRVAYKELSAFSISEINQELLIDHWLRGGFPDAFLTKKDENAKLWLQNFVMTYVERDLPQLGLNVSSTMLMNLWRIVASAQGELFNANNISRSLGLTSPTVSRYVDFMEEAFLLHRLRPFYINTSKRLVKSPKLYVRDSGILHYLTNNFDRNAFKTNVLTGASWEGYVIEQIRQNLDPSLSMYFYRTQAGTECDLVIADGIRAISCIEVKFSNSPKMTKSLTLSIEDLKTRNNYIITPNSDKYKLNDNVLVVNILEFINTISKYLSL